MSRDKQNIKATDWLTRGIPKEQLEREKREAIKEAEAELHNKQIEEMAKDVATAIKHNSAVDAIRYGLICVNTEGLTRELYDDGYRKASEVAEEIFAEIEKHIATKFPRLGSDTVAHLAELKKKYTEDKGRDKFAEFSKYSPLSWKNTEGGE